MQAMDKDKGDAVAELATLQSKLAGAQQLAADLEVQLQDSEAAVQGIRSEVSQRDEQIAQMTDALAATAAERDSSIEALRQLHEQLEQAQLGTNSHMRTVSDLETALRAEKARAGVVK
jgi:chromosome segregation ATPase